MRKDRGEERGGSREARAGELNLQHAAGRVLARRPSTRRVPIPLRGFFSPVFFLVLVLTGCARDPYRTDFTLSDNHGNSIRYSGPKDVHVGNVTSSTKTKSMEASLTISDYTANTSTNAISAYVEHAKVVSQGIIDGINAAANAAGTLGAAAAKKTAAPVP